MLKKEHKELIAEFYLTERCNMNCQYCFVAKGGRSMSLDTAKQAVDFIASLKYEKKIICFFGGEPLLELNLLKNVVNYAKKKKFKRFNVCTNATLLNKRVISYFKSNNIVPMLSIDGVRAAHDAERITKGRQGTFLRIEKKIALLLDFYKEDKIQLQITVTPLNAAFLKDSVSYFFNTGLNLDINIVPVFDMNPRYSWSQRTLKELENGIYEISELFIKEYKKGRSINISHMCCTPARDLLHFWDKTRVNRFCFAGSRHLSISVDGYIFPCFYFAGIENNKQFVLGSVWKGFSTQTNLSKQLFAASKKLYNGPVSCLVNNFRINNDILNPVKEYSRLDKYWERASRYVVNAVKK